VAIKALNMVLIELFVSHQHFAYNLGGDQSVILLYYITCSRPDVCVEDQKFVTPALKLLFVISASALKSEVLVELLLVLELNLHQPNHIFHLQIKLNSSSGIVSRNFPALVVDNANDAILMLKML
jgi:hypothetical protein